MLRAMKSIPSNQTRQARPGGYLQRGQALVELSLSVTLLLLLFSGIVDLGRAFFVKVALDSVISEGAHWAAAYPECIATAYNVTSAPQVPIQCRGTNSILGRMINENQDLNSSRIVALTVTPTTAQAGDTIVIKATYQLDTLTPIIQAMFGRSLLLSTEVKEVVRGAGVPASNGTPMINNGGVPPVQPLTDLQQVGLAGSCNNGVATLSWTAVSATGYHIKSPSPSPAIDDTVTPAGTVGTTITRSYSIGIGNSRQFTVTSYNDDGTNPVYDSAPATITVSCTNIQPTVLSYTCPPIGAYWSVNLTWTMPSPIDGSVTGYRIYRQDSASVYTTMSPDVVGSAATSGTVALTSTADQTKPYVVGALNGSTAVGAYSNALTINCSQGTGLTANYFNNQTLSGSPVITRVEAVNFDSSVSPKVNSPWPGSPITYSSGTYVNFSARWTGQVIAKYSQLYTFYIKGDDGVRLWVNGQLLVDYWYLQSATERSGQITLTEGQKYDIKLEYFQNTGDEVAVLSWSSASQAKQVIPSTYLYP
jgi:hypothetical protein